MPRQLGLAGCVTGVLALVREGAPAVEWTAGAVGVVAYQVVLASSLGLWSILTVSRSPSAIATNVAFMAVPIVAWRRRSCCRASP
ncbi:MAG: hypothetical protein GEU81_16270 [Nitriliruptorales bacterium]|nr:hypothetical protein [Nitriliruptorales bacterium]